jgi:hypothetical protein
MIKPPVIDIELFNRYIADNTHPVYSSTDPLDKLIQHPIQRIYSMLAVGLPMGINLRFYQVYGGPDEIHQMISTECSQESLFVRFGAFYENLDPFWVAVGAIREQVEQAAFHYRQLQEV